jgi:hypothetical protein
MASAKAVRLAPGGHSDGRSPLRALAKSQFDGSLTATLAQRPHGTFRMHPFRRSEGSSIHVPISSDRAARAAPPSADPATWGGNLYLTVRGAQWRAAGTAAPPADGLPPLTHNARVVEREKSYALMVPQPRPAGWAGAFKPPRPDSWCPQASSAPGGAVGAAAAAVPSRCASHFLMSSVSPRPTLASYPSRRHVHSAVLPVVPARSAGTHNDRGRAAVILGIPAAL